MSSSSDASVRIESLQWPVTVLGYGHRIGIWFQGCTIGCPGCCAKHTWEADDSKAVARADLQAWIETLPLDEVDGVTISGGEPFEQPDALLWLATVLRREMRFARDIDILCYSGLRWSRLVRSHDQILQQLDAVVTEPFVEHLPTRWLRGSSNQQIHALSGLGEERYGSSNDQRNELQLVAASDGIRLVGIPDRGDVDRWEQQLGEYGVTLGGTTRER